MSSDRTRISYDKDRQYRSIVAQQGRVTLESDWNESQVIVGEEARAEALDFVGSNGTPDNGYEIAASNTNTPFDFSIARGTMYVGGIRTVLNEDINYSYSQQDKQLDWLDRDPNSFPAWVDSTTLANPDLKTEFIYLYLQEQEISAIEDTALKEIALGGPDTTQRTRLIQKIVRLGVEANDCGTALNIAKEAWAKQGLIFNDRTMRLESSTKLKVSFQPPTIPPDLCEPEARGGYLEAENQLIRVKISAGGKLIWGYDNASFLYRTKLIGNKKLELQSRPVDEKHQPKKDKFVEILRSAVDLKKGDYIAQSNGIFRLATDYDPDNKQVTLQSDLPANYPNDPQLFLRIWEQELSFTPGQEVTLGNTGIKVTIQLPGDAHIGDYWQIAVRPASPNEIYPHRLESFQPPDGDRIWVCPLAVVNWNDGTLNILKDCRNRFDNLVELTKRKSGGGCCTVVVKPEDLNQNTTLQSIIDRYQNRQRVTICLMPGKYLLAEPILLNSKHSNLTIEGCHDGAVLEVEPGNETKFLQGLIVLTYANNITIRKLRFRLPLIPFIKAGGRLSLQATNTPQFLQSLKIDPENFYTSIGIRALHCAVLTVEDCLFRYILPKRASVFSVGIFAGSECWGLKVLNNRFLRDEEYFDNSENPYRLLIGYLLMPAIAIPDSPNPTFVAQPIIVPSLLEDAIFSDNMFSGLTIPMMTIADSGSIRIEKNTVRDSYSGVWLLVSIYSLKQLLDLFKVSPISISIILAFLFPIPDNFDLKSIVKLKLANPNLLARKIAPESGSIFENLGLTAVNVAGRFVTVTSKLFQQYSDLFQGLGIERLVAKLQISDNDIDTTLTKASFSTGLVVSRYRVPENRINQKDTRTSLILNSNKISNQPEQELLLPAVAISGIDYSTIHGNLIFNELRSESKISLLVTPQDMNMAVSIAVTGNIFKGKPQLPPRQFPVPLNTWEFLNTFI
jgi:hypothetical protein